MSAVQRASGDVRVRCVIWCMYVFKGMVVVVVGAEVADRVIISASVCVRALPCTSPTFLSTCSNTRAYAPLRVFSGEGCVSHLRFCVTQSASLRL